MTKILALLLGGILGGTAVAAEGPDENASVAQYRCVGWTHTGITIKVEFCAARVKGAYEGEVEIGSISPCANRDAIVTVTKFVVGADPSQRNLNIGKGSTWFHSDDRLLLYITDHPTLPEGSVWFTDHTTAPESSDEDDHQSLSIGFYTEGPPHLTLDLDEAGWWGYSFNNAQCFVTQARY